MARVSIESPKIILGVIGPAGVFLFRSFSASIYFDPDTQAARLGYDLSARRACHFNRRERRERKERREHKAIETGFSL
jgi:YD repeat-containing protein